jgi:hypothetical protein
MKTEECSYKIGDKVIFAPEQRVIGLNWSSFDRLNLFPGKIIQIGKFTDHGGIKTDIEGGSPCDQFIPFKENEKCSFEIGDIVRFTPSDRTKAGFDFSNRYMDPKLGKEYEIRKIVNDVWVFVDFDVWGFYWTDFTLISKAEKRLILPNKSVGQLLGEILSLMDKSIDDDNVRFRIKNLKENFRGLEKASNFKEKWNTYARIENGAMGGNGRMIYLHLTPKQNAELDEEQLNKKYVDLVYGLYWAARIEKEKLALLVDDNE